MDTAILDFTLQRRIFAENFRNFLYFSHKFSGPRNLEKLPKNCLFLKKNFVAIFNA